MRGISCLLVWSIYLSGFLARGQVPVENSEPEKDYFRFVTRPDIEPATWRVLIKDESRVAPGYWFVSPYEKNGYRQPGLSWIGPHIYDGHGELIWSGSHLFNRINVMDFKVVNVGGTDMLSMLYAVEGNAYILDNSYRIKETVFTGVTGVTFNMHDFHTVEDGQKYLYLQRNITEASEELSMNEVGFDGKCKVTFPGFEERDVHSKEILFKWDGTGNLPLSESTMTNGPVENRCSQYWDYSHSNAIDKFADGNYLLSTRHCDTIYKISKDDGSIMWKLHGHGGERSDFDMGDLRFSRQHHARIHEENTTHTIITFLDNGVGGDAQPATGPLTRALMVALREDVRPMTAEVVKSYDHPFGQHAFRRGSYQILPNGNAFVGWSEHALQSEHTSDGELIMQAELETRKLEVFAYASAIGTYRTFKFEFVGKPDYPPDVFSEASAGTNGSATAVHVSWNGATEVSTWVLYKSDAARKRTLKLSSVPRSGFETKLTYDGYAKYVFVEAIDRNGESLGESKVFETIAGDDIPGAVLLEETRWLEEGDLEGDSSDGTLSGGVLTFIGGVVCGCAVFIGLWTARTKGVSWQRGRRKGPSYRRVAEDDAWEFDESKLDDLSPVGASRRRFEDEDYGMPEDVDDDDSDERGRHNRTPSTGDSSAG